MRKWIANKSINPHAQWRVFAFPCAGAGASYFRTWQDQFPAHVDILPVQLPGRENRFGEPRFVSLSALLSAINQGLEPYLDKPFVFFGHSFGALLGYVLALKRQMEGKSIPKHLFVAGYRAPHLPPIELKIHHLPDEEFMQSLIAYGGIPDEIANHRELLKLIAPTAKADIMMHETYIHAQGEKLRCPITAWGGETDKHIDAGAIRAWQEETSGAFSYKIFSGGHYFIREHQTEIIQTIQAAMRSVCG